MAWLKLLVTNRFTGAATAGEFVIMGSRVTYNNRGSLYGMFKEIFIDQNYLIESTKEPLKIIDCGSNIGLSVLYFKFKAPNASVTTFEPNPHTFELLEKNISSNVEGVTLVKAGVASEKGEVTFYTDHDDRSSQSASTSKHLLNKQRPLEPMTVQMHTLSSYIDSEIDVLKLDIEGAEGEVVDELSRTGKLRLIKKLFIEFHYDGVNTTHPLGQLLMRLEDAGLKYVMDTGISFPFDHLHSKSNYSTKITAWR